MSWVRLRLAICMLVLSMLGGGAPLYAQSAPTVTPPANTNDTVTTQPRKPPPTIPPKKALRAAEPVTPPPAPDDPSEVDTGNGGRTTATTDASPSQRPAPPPSPASSSNRSSELLVASDNTVEAEQQRAWLAAQGITIIRRRSLGNLGWMLSVYRLPPGIDLQSLTERLMSTWPQAMAEPNQRYPALETTATDSLPVEYAKVMIDWPKQRCSAQVRLAMLDGAINAQLPVFSRRKISIENIAPPDLQPDQDHGTAIAALLLSDVSGLLPDAELFVGVVMRQESGKHYTTTEWVLRGFDWLLGLPQSPAVLNLSFGGPASQQLERAMPKLLARMRVVAAAGNDGKDAAVFPAAYPGVVGVSAIDARFRRWPQANTGRHVAIAAPGVDVWTLNGAGDGYYASGTSFATVFVSAALSLSTPSQAQIIPWLTQHSRDLGSPAHDAQFGYGALTLNGTCK